MVETGAFDGPLTPPTSGMPVIDKPQTKWPTVLGIAGIVLAVAALPCNCAGYFHLMFHRMGLEWMAESGAPIAAGEVQLQVAQRFNVFWMILVTVGLGLAVWLLIGAISLVRRRPSARTHLVGYAIASLLFVALDVVLQLLMLHAAITELGNRGESQHADEVWKNLGVGVFFSITLGTAFQTFLLVWLLRAKIQEEVATWRT